MPSINRIRVNNVKYNFGTQFYDDFTMRMYGKNTLYDLANGGGKSILMLLLLQNMIPNCTLDEKQPLEKLFRTGNGNTTIHSLVEWKLDESDSSEGYRYMTTGFCARKAKDAEDGAEAKNDVASVEYFNYCIFYREYNKNDIVNLPLTKDGERVSFQGLRNYLKDLEHRDMGLMVRIFDRKGEYQRFISGYGIHESQWEIIRGINKTEGHVRTYFENNFRTTRKVVEDLLIEEIIEKAFLVKTERDEDGSESMAKLLMDIKEQLAVLAKKKKDISGYDHQVELLTVLKDKVNSFMELYQEQDKLSRILADICVTGAEFAKNDEQRMEELARARDEKRQDRENHRKRIECLKVARDRKKLEEMSGEEKAIQEKLSVAREKLEELLSDLNRKEGINEYMDYLEDKRKYNQQDTVIRTMMAESDFDEEQLYTYAYNIKMRMDVVLTDLRGQCVALEETIRNSKVKKEYGEKLLSEARTALAVAINTKKNADEEIISLSEKLSNIRMSMNSIRFTELTEQMETSDIILEEIQSKIKSGRKVVEESTRMMNEERLNLSMLEAKKQENDELIAHISDREKEYQEAWDKLDNMKEIYGAEDENALAKLISGRITQTVLEVAEIKRSLEKSRKRSSRLEEGRILGISQSAQRVLNYLETRHGISGIYGMDYLCALPLERRQELLNVNPELAYGILVREYDTVKSDSNISTLDTGDTIVNIYDMEMLEEKAIHFGENILPVHASAEYLTDSQTVGQLLEAEEQKCKEYEQQLEIKEEMLTAYHQDQEFILRIVDSEFLTAKERLSEAKKEDKKIKQEIEACREKIKSLQRTISAEEQSLTEKQQEYEETLADHSKLYTAGRLSEVIAEQEELSSRCVKEIERLEEEVRTLIGERDGKETDYAEQEAKLATLQRRQDEILEEWNRSYKAYYDVEKEYEILPLSDDELTARFTAIVQMGNEGMKAVEDKKLLLETIRISMERTMKSIEKRGISQTELEELEKENKLFVSDERLLTTCKKSIEGMEEQIREYEGNLKEKESARNRLEGSIAYAIQNIEAAFGEFEEEEASLSEIVSNLENGEALLVRLEKEVRECDEAYKRYAKQQGYMLDLYKDVKRIVVTHEISLESAVPMVESKEKLREIFEENLLSFDKSTKALDKAKNELLRFKGNTSAALDQMEAYELAATIRDDVIIPSDYGQAKDLTENLTSIVEYIKLERDRVEKSLVDMESLKSNFEEQCLQRCLDVRTELDKLPKLSRIVADGEAIQMVGLTVPYVKEEFLKQRMSEYIDRIVAQTDDYESDKERMRFIRNSLALKKLFGVIVTDMNGIKLSLYKRERIKEQSRYLRYEEAVGSTGQSQGIYIQFLISIINYISGMYQTGNEDERTKTIFIDNPFGAAKDVYIWEPIFALLAANKVQLIVPARGATPAITGRFDVNYILGQQMTGGKQLTVVTDYTSKVDQEELEYQDLEYEQVSFDFI